MLIFDVYVSLGDTPFFLLWLRCFMLKLWLIVEDSFRRCPACLVRIVVLLASIGESLGHFGPGVVSDSCLDWIVNRTIIPR